MHMTALVEATSQLLRQVRAGEHAADHQIAQFFRDQRQYGPRERAQMTDAVYANLRQRWWFEHLARSAPGERDWALACLGLASAGVAVGESLAPEAQTWLAEALAREAPANLDDPMRHNLPQWLAKALQAQIGEEAWPLAQSLLHSAPLDLRVNTARAKRDAVLRALQAAGHAGEPTPHSPWGLRLAGKPALQRHPLFTQGAFEVQDEGSQLLALLLGAKRGDMVADFCAGAGGKTLAVASQMRDSGRVYAFDTSARRLEAMAPRLARAGLTQVFPTVIAHESDERLARLAGKMDRVLVDAPCSGLGTLRRSPDLKWRQTEATVADYAALQANILRAAARLVKPGGRLVYATCSLLDAENEAVALAFSQEMARSFQPLSVAEALTKAKVAQADSLCTPLGQDGVTALRLWPHRHGTDGFFAAMWERRA